MRIAPRPTTRLKRIIDLVYDIFVNNQRFSMAHKCPADERRNSLYKFIPFANT